jgi:hypothetical protein
MEFKIDTAECLKPSKITVMKFAKISHQKKTPSMINYQILLG